MRIAARIIDRQAVFLATAAPIPGTLQRLGRRTGAAAPGSYVRSALVPGASDIGVVAGSPTTAPYLAAGTPMRVRLIQAADLSAEECAIWSALQRGDPTVRHPFVHPGFALAVGSTQPEVEVAILEPAGSIAGFFAFQRTSSRAAGPVAPGLSDQQAVVVDPDLEWDAVELLRACDLDSWSFDHLVATQAPLQAFHHELDEAAYMDLSGGYDAYVAGRREARSSVVSASMRKARKLERELGRVRLEVHSDEPAVFSALLEWKRIHLARQGFAHSYQRDWAIKSLDLLRQARGEEFAAVLTALYAGDELAAVQLGLRSFDVFAAWIPTYRPELSRYSPGVILQLHLARELAAQGIGSVDLGRGIDPTKARLMSHSVPLAIGCVDVRPLRHQLRKAWRRTRSALRDGLPDGPPRRIARRLGRWLGRGG